MSEATMIQPKTCFNCHYECVEHLKAGSETCSNCIPKGDKDNRFPNWKKVE